MLHDNNMTANRWNKGVNWNTNILKLLYIIDRMNKYAVIVNVEFFGYAEFVFSCQHLSFHTGKTYSGIA